jgi:hypothetical protein
MSENYTNENRRSASSVPLSKKGQRGIIQELRAMVCLARRSPAHLHATGRLLPPRPVDVVRARRAIAYSANPSVGRCNRPWAIK